MDFVAAGRRRSRYICDTNLVFARTPDMSKLLRPVTMKNVAAAAGVSYQTVSRAVNGFVDINPKTRERVLQIARSLATASIDCKQSAQCTIQGHRTVRSGKPILCGGRRRRRGSRDRAGLFGHPGQFHEDVAFASEQRCLACSSGGSMG